jgi:hypothetical protein
MVKIILLSIIILTIPSFTDTSSPLLQKNCLNCHRAQKIPSEFIYRRYLLKYSTNRVIKKKLLNYLTSPKKEASIMPKQFFLKFPEKKVSDLNKTILNKSIKEYLEYFNVKNKLVLP